MLWDAVPGERSAILPRRAFVHIGAHGRGCLYVNGFCIRVPVDETARDSQRLLAWWYQLMYRRALVLLVSAMSAGVAPRDPWTL